MWFWSSFSSCRVSYHNEHLLTSTPTLDASYGINVRLVCQDRNQVGEAEMDSVLNISTIDGLKGP